MQDLAEIIVSVQNLLGGLKNVACHENPNATNQIPVPKPNASPHVQIQDVLDNINVIPSDEDDVQPDHNSALAANVGLRDEADVQPDQNPVLATNVGPRDKVDVQPDQNLVLATNAGPTHELDGHPDQNSVLTTNAGPTQQPIATLDWWK